MILLSPTVRWRRLGLALLLLAVPACGLSDYEKLMYEAQEREKRFRDEKKYLGTPVRIPTQKDKEDHDVPVVNMFFRPPLGIDSRPRPRGDLMWRYPADTRGSDFKAVDLILAEDSKDFASRVEISYEGSRRSARSTPEITPLGQTEPMIFDRWEWSSGQNGYSVNILRGSSKPVAIVYIYNRSQLDSARKAIELSLESLGVDQKVGAARQRYDQNSPWKLEAQPRS